MFFDDILIYSSLLELHLQHLAQVLQQRREHQKVNKKKCSFAQDATECLGHVISGAGVSAEPKKIEAIWKWPNPKDATALHEFWASQVTIGDLCKIMKKFPNL